MPAARKRRNMGRESHEGLFSKTAPNSGPDAQGNAADTPRSKQHSHRRHLPAHDDHAIRVWALARCNESFGCRGRRRRLLGAKLRRIRALTLKETRQILRYPSRIAIGVIFPLMMILLFGKMTPMA